MGIFFYPLEYMHTIDSISIDIDGGVNLFVNPEQQEH